MKRRLVMEQNKLTNDDVIGRDEIRQIQVLMILFSCLSPDSELRKVLEHALALPHEHCLSRIFPTSDTSLHGLKTWLETLWTQGELTPDEQKLVDWQRSKQNTEAAVQELKAIEEKIGLKLGIQRIHREHELPSGVF
jgi:hypothetical protein